MKDNLDKSDLKCNRDMKIQQDTLVSMLEEVALLCLQTDAPFLNLAANSTDVIKQQLESMDYEDSSG